MQTSIFPKYTFPTRYTDILARIAAIQPSRYAASRNFIDGKVTYLSPYISRGTISLVQIKDSLIQRGFTYQQSEKLIQELAWREYFQRLWQALGNELFQDLKQKQERVHHHLVPEGIVNGTTGVSAIDHSIQQLYTTGYMHNHSRMYLAALACNVGGAHWLQPSRWLYYHLLDGDVASNTCSWQWVVGTFGKKYYANQENINRYMHTADRGTMLDVSYDELPLVPVPQQLQSTCLPELKTNLPKTTLPYIDPKLPVLLYHSYHLDPAWRSEIQANRLLLLEPSHFAAYPVSDMVINFIIELATNIPGIQIYAGEIGELKGIAGTPYIATVSHPTVNHYPGQKDSAAWLFPEVQGYYPSFSAYWRKCERLAKRWWQ